MKRLTQIYAIASFMAASFAAHSQTIVPGTQAYVDTEIDALGVRPNGQLFAYLHLPLAMSCMSAPGGAGRQLAFIFTTSTDYKLIKEIIQLSYAMKKRVRVYSSSCYLAHATDPNFQYPVIQFIDTL